MNGERKELFKKHFYQKKRLIDDKCINLVELKEMNLKTF